MVRLNTGRYTPLMSKNEQSNGCGDQEAHMQKLGSWKTAWKEYNPPPEKKTMEKAESAKNNQNAPAATIDRRGE